MERLRNIEISRDELLHYLNLNTNLTGREGKIFNGIHPNEARKIFHVPINGTKKELEKFYAASENKAQKLALLHEKNIDNDIVPIRTISYDKILVGYDMTSSSLSTPETMTIENLEQLKVKLERFHNQGIVHGDIKKSNILINQNGEVVLCDLDNMQVDNYPIDCFCFYIRYFIKNNKLVDKNADIYLANLFLLQQLYFKEDIYDEIIDELMYEEFPEDIQGQGREELFKMQQCFPKYEGNYLIDNIINKEKVYGKTTKSNSTIRSNI